VKISGRRRERKGRVKIVKKKSGKYKK